MLQIFRGQADPLVIDFKLPHDAPALVVEIEVFTLSLTTLNTFLIIFVIGIIGQ